MIKPSSFYSNISLLLLVCCLFTSSTFATHIVGGQIEYRWLSGNDFEFTLTFYRDCSGSSAPSSIDICFFDKSTDAFIQEEIIQLTSAQNLVLGDQCYTPPGICVEENVYTGTINLANNPNGYYFYEDQFARNGIITNLSLPGSTGMTWYGEMPDPALQNSGPSFSNYPKGYFCDGFPNQENLSSVDADGDSLAYKLVSPLDQPTGFGCAPKPYPTVQYLNSNYSFSQPLGAGSSTTINATSGLLTATPNGQGTFVIAYAVEEWRNGQKIGEIRRDMQYTVLACSPNLSPNFKVDGTFLTDTTTVNSLVVPAGDTLCFDLVLSDLNNGDIIYFAPDSTTLGLDPESSPVFTLTHFNNVYINVVDSNSIARAQACIYTQCANIRPETYQFRVTGSDSSCYIANKVNYIMDVKVVIPGESDLYPNVFTPNGDGVNDFFKTDAEPDYCFDEYEVTIYNRWGARVYESTDFLFQWDGQTKGGNDAPEGSYFYVITSRFQETSNEIKGFVHLLR